MAQIGFDEFEELFKNAGFDLDEELYRKFYKYAELLVETNEKINLTAITDPEGIAQKHFLDSVLPLKMADFPDNCRLADVGTGAGFPGVPIKLMRPDIDLTLIDSLLKRVNFLNMLCNELKIEAKCLHIRAEDAGKGDLKESFDVVTARAVSRLDRLAGYCLPLVKIGGIMAALKGGECSEEIRLAEEQIRAFGGELVSAEKYSLPGGDGRTLVVIKKMWSARGKKGRH